MRSAPAPCTTFEVGVFQAHSAPQSGPAAGRVLGRCVSLPPATVDGANLDPQERARGVAAPHQGRVGAGSPHALWGPSGRPRSLAAGARFRSGSVASGPSDRSPGGRTIQKPQAGGDRGQGCWHRRTRPSLLWPLPVGSAHNTGVWHDAQGWLCGSVSTRNLHRVVPSSRHRRGPEAPGPKRIQWETEGFGALVRGSLTAGLRGFLPDLSAWVSREQELAPRVANQPPSVGEGGPAAHGPGTAVPPP